MANRFYGKGLEKFSSGLIDLTSATIKMLLCSNSYTPNTATDEFHADIPGGAIIATSSALSSKTVTQGVFDAADKTFTAVTGSTVTQIVFWKDTGSSATSPLLTLFDSATGLPVTPNGGDIAVAFNASGIWSL